MLTDAGSTPAISTTCNTGLDLSRPDISHKFQTLEETRQNHALVSSGLEVSTFCPQNDTNAAQDPLKDIGTRECKSFRNEIFNEFEQIQSALIQEYLYISKRDGYVAANIQLRKRQNQLSYSTLNLAAYDSELKVFAREQAFFCGVWGAKLHLEEAVIRSERMANAFSFQIDSSLTAQQKLNRLSDRNWWYRKARALRNQTLAEIERDMGFVCQRFAPYASERSVQNLRATQTKQAEFMKQRELINHKGECITLAECAESNTSNPEIRFAELMVRIKGFEEIANEQNHTGVFLTITTPSRMHRSLSKHGVHNPKFDGTTPKQANEHLCRVGERVRAHLHRNNITPYGFRVAEPHHDGTPHWHLLLFVPEHHVNSLIYAYKKYALEESPNEKGAQKYRFKAEIIDKNKGSAAGYIVKYISKSINGKGVGEDSYGNNAIESSERIITWAKDHRIRQFQQIGGPSVTVWRELRRLKQVSNNPALEAARKAADKSDWAAFVRAMGGPTSNKSSQPIQVHYDHVYAIDTETAEVICIDKNKYDETATKSIRGLSINDQFIATRFLVWHPLRKLKPVLDMSAKALEKAHSFGSSIVSEARDSWTCVNNCTEVATSH